VFEDDKSYNILTCLAHFQHLAFCYCQSDTVNTERENNIK